MEIVFPILLLQKDCGDLLLYNSMEDMRSDLEPIDVENDEYDVWDGNLRKLRLIVHAPTKCFAAYPKEWLELEVESNEKDVLAVKKLFEQYVSSVGVNTVIEDIEYENIGALWLRIEVLMPKRSKKHWWMF